MARRRPGQPGASFDDIKPDPSRVGGVAEAPFVRLPDPATLFEARARRLAELAPGHGLEPYLRFLNTVVGAQADAVLALPAPLPVPADQVAQRAEHGFPPIGADQVHGPDMAATLAFLLDAVELAAAPEATRAAADAVRAMPEAERLALAGDVFTGSFPTDRIGECLFVAAALQVHLARLAAQLDAATLQSPAEGVCPACGAAPVSSMVVGWTPANKARYCACSNCGTLWNHVRIKCTACGATDGIAYYTVEASDGPPLGVETCTACSSYIKHMQQHEDTRLDPVADDVGSYALDLLAQEQGFRRAGLNPLFLAV